MNYYFRSKEILFETIIDLLIGKASASLKEILNAQLELEIKIEKYISRYIDILIDNPLLISFVLKVLNRNPEKLTQIKVADNLYNSEIFSNQLKEEAEKGNIRAVNPEQLYINMLSLIAFPFAIKEMINHRNNYTNNDFIHFIQSRKKVIYEMIISYLQPKKQNIMKNLHFNKRLQILLLVLTLGFLFSCSPEYIPNMANSPMFSNQG